MPGGQKKQTAIPDFSTIQFPSDRITIAQIRKEQPYMFTRDALGEAHAGNFDAVNTIRCELILAEKAWAAALGRPDPQPDCHRLEEIAMLNDDYVRYGLSTGIWKTRQLVRDFEKAVAAQAQIAEGRGASPDFSCPLLG